MCVKCDKVSTPMGLRARLWAYEFDIETLRRGDGKVRNAAAIRTLEERVAQIREEITRRDAAGFPADTDRSGDASKDGSGVGVHAGGASSNSVSGNNEDGGVA